MAYNDQAKAREGEKKSNRKLIFIIVAVIAVAGLLAILYFTLSFSSILNGNGAQQHKGALPPSAINNASLEEQDLLTYNLVKQYVPYALVNYTVTNVTNINANVSLYYYAPPSSIFILNISDQCFNCGDTSAIESAMINKLMAYNVIESPANLSEISISNVRSLPDDSLLIVLNGLLPYQFLAPVSANTTVLDTLMQRHVSILYVGQAFSSVLLPDSVVIPAQHIPGYLYTLRYSGNAIKNNGFYFNKSTFYFTNGSVYSGYLTYVNVYNGSIAAFPNTPTSWKTSQEAGNDIAKAVQDMFWLPKYAYGTRTVNTIKPNSTGRIGVVLDNLEIPYNTTFVANVESNGAMRVVLTANATYSYGRSTSVYQYIVAKPLFYDNGTIGINRSIITNQTVPLSFSIHTHSQVPENIQPHLSIYNLNMTLIFSTPLAFIHNVTDNFTFLIPYQRLVLQPGQGYVMKLHSFYGQEYGGAFFNVSPLNLYLIGANVSTGRFNFSVTSNNQSVTNLNYTISLNGQYPEKGTIKYGFISYTLPQDVSVPRGSLNFTLNVSGSTFYYHTSYNPLPFKINQQYIEVVVVVVIMLVMIIFVKAPYRDEFYIDVPHLPEEKKTQVQLKATDIVNVFDRLNTSYRWKYMPLSKTEVRSAIASYIKYNSIPVSLTYSNVEQIIGQLTVKKYLVSADELYAPVEWVTGSGHDIEYLSTFKKLRIFLVTHAFIFTDIDISKESDVVATLHGERKYIVLYSKTSKFQNIPIYPDWKTYIVFLNNYRLEEFRNNLYVSTTFEAEELKMYMAADHVRLIDADNPEGLLS
ncbi:MAG: hypothetical protein KGI06_02495 [Candidatus Micrarchaeota archaeon]|nr:hypothetical protein [Candidatus Micrarchaeota archaeon]